MRRRGGGVAQVAYAQVAWRRWRGAGGVCATRSGDLSGGVEQGACKGARSIMQARPIGR